MIKFNVHKASAAASGDAKLHDVVKQPVTDDVDSLEVVGKHQTIVCQYEVDKKIGEV